MAGRSRCPHGPEVVGVLPRPDGEAGALAGSVVVDDHLVRLWPGQVEAIALSRNDPEGSG